MIQLQTSCESISGEAIQTLLKKVELKFYSPEKHEIAFKNSAKTVFLVENEKLIGCGRLLSDLAYQAALYDIAVDPAYQGQGWGRKIIETLLEGYDDFNILLYTSPGKESFYQEFGFRSAKTGMARFLDPD